MDYDDVSDEEDEHVTFRRPQPPPSPPPPPPPPPPQPVLTSASSFNVGSGVSNGSTAAPATAASVTTIRPRGLGTSAASLLDDLHSSWHDSDDDDDAMRIDTLPARSPATTTTTATATATALHPQQHMSFPQSLSHPQPFPIPHTIQIPTPMTVIPMSVQVPAPAPAPGPAGGVSVSPIFSNPSTAARVSSASSSFPFRSNPVSNSSPLSATPSLSLTPPAALNSNVPFITPAVSTELRPFLPAQLQPQCERLRSDCSAMVEKISETTEVKARRGLLSDIFERPALELSGMLLDAFFRQHKLTVLAKWARVSTVSRHLEQQPLTDDDWELQLLCALATIAVQGGAGVKNVDKLLKDEKDIKTFVRWIHKSLPAYVATRSGDLNRKRRVAIAMERLRELFDLKAI